MKAKKQIVNPIWFVLPAAIWMLVSLWLALQFKYGHALTKELTNMHYRIFASIFLVWLLIMFIHNLFDPTILRRYTTMFFSLLSAAFFNFLVAVLYFYFQPQLILTPRRFLLLTVGIWFILSLLWYLIIKFLLQNKLTEEYYLFSPNGELEELRKEILQHSYLGFRAINYFSDLEQLVQLEQSNINLIVVEHAFMNQETSKKLYGLRSKGADIISQIDFSERLLRRIPLVYLSEIWFLQNIWTKANRLQIFFSRFLDIVIGVLFGLVFLSTFPLIVLLIKINSRGPIFFMQERIGKNGEIFKVLKYRTMLAASSGKGWTQINDPRITAAGRVLRRLHLDELPQFYNLLAGNMGIVGPRPEQTEIVAQMRQVIPFYDERHWIKPGLTGWAQLNIYAGTVEATRLKLEYDLYYLKNRSVLFDFEIMLKTLYFIVRNKR